MQIFNKSHTISATSEVADLYDYSDLTLDRIVMKKNRLPLEGTFYFKRNRRGESHELSILNTFSLRKFRRIARGMVFYVHFYEHSHYAYDFQKSSKYWDGLCCVSKTQFKHYLEVNHLPYEEFTEDNVLKHLNNTTANAMTCYANGWLYSVFAADEEKGDGITSYYLFINEEDALDEGIKMCVDYFGEKPKYLPEDFIKHVSYSLCA